MVKAQEWLDKNYPREGWKEEWGCWNSRSQKYEKKEWRTRSEVEEIYLNEPSLEGGLDLGDFTHPWGVKVYISPRVDETKLTFKNLPNYGKVNLINAQRDVNYHYPTKQEREKITELDINLRKLEETLDLNDFSNLKILNCCWNKLTSLDCSNCQQLEEIDCRDNKLTNITLPTNLTNLKKLNLSSNNLPNQDLINRFGSCLKCYQPNSSKKWCQPCAEKEWEKLEGQELIEKFIQQQKERNKYSNLKWIPYEKFTNIEHTADGGFSKIYKAWWENNLALKFLNNSQRITLEFLSEVANTKLIKDRVVKCYGISQDPQTKNYVMVMEYMERGNLRQFLQNKAGKLSLEDKLKRLKDIADGLYNIHDQNLIHRDFHSGNILNDVLNQSCISDFGLSYPANYQKQAGQIFGVLPYIAPEVLRGQPYTQKSDIYSFGIIAYELLANSYPYSEMDNMNLALQVCQGYRPNIDKVPIPQLLKDLINRCWNADPEKRPSARELKDTIEVWESKEERSWHQGFEQKISHQQFRQELQALKDEYNNFSQNTPYKIHSTATLTSKMIDTKEITKRLNDLNLSEKLNIQKSKEIFIKDSEEIAPIGNTGLTKEIENLSTRTKRQLSLSSQNELLPQIKKTTGLTGLLEGVNIAEQEFQSEPMEIDYNWTNIHPKFAPQLTQSWQNLNFSCPQTQDWINIGLQPTDANFATWLRDEIKLTPEQLLNDSSRIEDLREQFQFYLQDQLQTAYSKKEGKTAWESWETSEGLGSWIKELEKQNQLQSQIQQPPK